MSTQLACVLITGIATCGWVLTCYFHTHRTDEYEDEGDGI
jgi:hypothetical protein